MKVLDGNILAEKKLDEVVVRARAIEKKRGIRPGLAVILIGDDAASHLYVGLKQKAAQSVGIDVHRYDFVQEEPEEDVERAIEFLVADPDVDAILIQMPVPEKFNAERLVKIMGEEKDVDGFHEKSVQKFLEGAQEMWPVFPHALLAIAESAGENLTGKRAALIVKSETFGSVLAQACKKRGLVPQIILEDKLPCMQAAVLGADVVITACGTPGLVTNKYIKNGAIVIDGGISKVNGETTGDVDRESLNKAKKDGYISPVPGGVGPMTIACLLENVVTLAEKRL